ncbi:RNA methyltransferase [Candidatus Sumerlaeota bacterium]|nr:RNA methyltransferase [Candidatus Sumerlaeota bacterium]
MKKISISSRNAEYQIIQSLKMNRVKRKKANEVFVEGIESIKQAINARMEFTRIIFSDIDRLSNWARNLINKNTHSRIIDMSYDLYRNLCDRDELSEILATVKIVPLKLQDLVYQDKPFVLIFDRPSDCGNLGSIIRSANSFGVDAIFVIGHAIDIYDPKVIRSSLGSVFHSKIVPIQSINELEKWIKIQKDVNNISVVGTDSTGDVSLLHRSLHKPIALILGNEAKGMSVALKAMCDMIISVPISGAVNSLNVSCAGSIFLWEIYKNSCSNQGAL